MQRMPLIHLERVHCSKTGRDTLQSFLDSFHRLTSITLLENRVTISRGWLQMHNCNTEYGRSRTGPTNWSLLSGSASTFIPSFPRIAVYEVDQLNALCLHNHRCIGVSGRWKKTDQKKDNDGMALSPSLNLGHFRVMLKESGNDAKFITFRALCPTLLGSTTGS